MGKLNRRKFLAWLGGTAAGFAAAPILDIDKLLWSPGEKKIFLPSLKECVKFTVGDVFTLDGVFAVNPLNYKTLPMLKQFVVTQDITSDGRWDKTFPMYPMLIDRGPYQTVSRIPVFNQKILPYMVGEVIGRSS